ncbi:MAG TPA: TonB-dependent receptor [Candidatus Latescibacteria bacterium]|nr:TonB-dependent receptor [Candidatus Latescibacterota bacterium]
MHALGMLLAGLLFASSAFGGEIAGRVLDSQTGSPLPGVAVYIPKLGVGTASDTSGAFSLKGVPEGEHTLKISMIGYRPEELEVRVGKEPAFVKVALYPQVYHMAEIVVTALKGEDLILKSPAFVGRIEGRELRERATSLPEVLEGMAGVRVKKLGGLGDYAAVSIRGSSSQQVRVYIDEVPLNDAFWGGVNLGSLPVGVFSRVEVYRGVIPMSFGGSGTGGVVRLVTPRTGTKGYGALMSGSFGAIGAFCLASHRGFLAGVEYLRAENDYPFLDDNGTRYNPEDDVWIKRYNNDFRSTSLLAKLSLPVKGAKLSLWDLFFSSHKGLPGAGNAQAKHARLKQLRNLSGAEVEAPLGVSLFRAELFWSRYVSEFRDPYSEIGLGRQDNHNATDMLGFRGSLRSARGNLSGTALLEARREMFRPSDRIRRTPLPASDRTSVAWGLEGVYLRDKLEVQASLRGDHMWNRCKVDYVLGVLRPVPEERKEYGFSGARLGVRLTLAPGLHIKGNIGRYFRAPSFYELFGDTGPVIGNTKLKPEFGLNFDFGFVLTAGGARMEVVYYDNRIRDGIVFVQHSQFTSKPENLGKAKIRGVELSWRARFGPLCWEGHGSYQEARNLSELYGGIYRGKQLPNRPLWTAHGRWSISWKNIKGFYEADYTSGNYHDLYNKFPIPERFLHNLGLSLTVPPLSIEGEVKNATDRHASDLWGYPLPGRSYYLRLRIGG